MIDFAAILRKEILYSDLGGKGNPPAVYVKKSEIKEFAEPYKGTPAYDKFTHPDGFTYGNTRIIPE